MPWEPILPKHPIVLFDPIRRECDARMRRLVNDLQRACANYEVPSETSRISFIQRVRSKKSGRLIKRRGKRILGYKRTGTLKKSWSHRVGWSILAGTLVGEVRSSGNVAPYNKYVRDPLKQTRVMKQLGWRTTTDIMEEYWPPAERAFERILRAK